MSLYLSVARLAACALVFAVAPASAALYRVGLGGTLNGCTHSSLQAAIDTAKNHAGPDTIYLIQGMTDAGQALNIEGQDLTIVGGYENCLDPEIDLVFLAIS